ncbi:TonB-dependent receptor domain-containing protein [Telluria beijingensis]|uniref:TonB-dependent receptor domain-containing protein n=1 Tax=Telluria beijingensis TaxID=3068633 RepID=UPI00279612E0|nr:TonB-dependent receptor [Massilia sp. REN29]
MRACAALLVVVSYLLLPHARGAEPDGAAAAPDLAAIRVIDIPAQALDAALVRFTQLTGFQLLYSPHLVQALRSAAIRGHMTPREALARMLYGSRLEVVDTAPGAAALRRTASLPTTDDDDAPMSVLVTARRFSEPVFEVPISITVASARALQRQGARSIADALRAVAGVSVQPAGAGMDQISIRGIATSLGGNANGYYLDDLPFTGVTVPISPDVRTWDLERVEVLRGPQGTLFGEGSMGGTVRTLTNHARLDRTEFAAQAGARLTRDGAASRSLDTMANLPLLRGRLAVRVAASTETEGGWIDEAPGGRHDLNRTSIDTARLRMRFQASDALQLNATWWTYRNRLPYQNMSLDSGRASQAMLYDSALRYTLKGISASYDFGPVTAFYSHVSNRFDLPQSGNLVGAGSQASIAIDLAAHELRLASTATAPWRWTVGLYQRGALRNDRVVVPQYSLDQASHTGSLARSLYGDVAYLFPGTGIEANLGLRYFRDRLTGHETAFGPAGGSSTSSIRFGSASPRLALTWRRSERHQVYASAAKGFRSGQNQVGGFERIAAANQVDLPASIRPDTLWTYELGTKLSLPGRGIAAELALYHTDWNDVAVRIPLGQSGLNGLITSPGIKTNGIDASLAYTPNASFSASLAAGINRSRHAGEVAGTGIRRGSPLDDVPDLTLAASAEYRFAPLAGWKPVLCVGVTHAGIPPSSTFPQFADGDPITNASASLGVARGPWSLTVSGDNLLDERGATRRRDAVNSATGSELVAPRLRPPTLGLQLRYTMQ